MPHSHVPLALLLSVFAAVLPSCWSSPVQLSVEKAAISAAGRLRLLRNPGKKSRRRHEIVRGDILEQVAVGDQYTDFCATSALDVAEEVARLDELETLTPFSDLSTGWLRRLRHHKLHGWSLKDMQKRRSLLENVTRAKRQLLSGHPTLLDLSDEEVASAKKKLTSWHCLKAHGSNYGEPNIRMTCKFKNLYFEAIQGEGAFVAHTLDTDGVTSLPRMSVGAGSNFMDVTYPIELVRHKSIKDFLHHILNSSIVEHPGITLPFAPLYHFNVGHGLFDGLYPAFVSLLQHGDEDKPFRPLILFRRYPEMNKKCPACYQHVEDIFSMIGGLNTTHAHEMINASSLHRLEEAVIGIGTNTAKIDMNVNFTLGACRALDACRAFRKRIYQYSNVTLPEYVRDAGPFRVNVVENKRFKGSWGALVEWMQNESRSTLSNFSANGVAWTPAELQAHAQINPQSVQVGDFRSHLKVLSQTDVLVSSPGTAMMYQTFLPDGAVLVNMGDDHFSYMEEYMAEGTPYLRALYYPLRTLETNVLFESRKMRTLLGQAHELLSQRLTQPVPVNQNLSPMGKFYKAFAYWKHGQVVSLEMLSTDVPPQRAFHDIDMLGNAFLGPEEFKKWCCHQNGALAGVMHAMANAYQDANPQHNNFFEELLITPSTSLHYEQNLSTYLKLASLV